MAKNVTKFILFDVSVFLLEKGYLVRFKTEGKSAEHKLTEILTPEQIESARNARLRGRAFLTEPRSHSDSLAGILKSASTLPPFVYTPPSEEMEKVGESLFSRVFSEVARGWLSSAFDSIYDTSGIVRVRLEIRSDSKLQQLPWQYLYSSIDGQFLGVNVKSVISYQCQSVKPPQRIKLLDDKLRILVLLSQPNGVPELDLDGEWGRIEESLGSLIKSEKVLLEPLHRASLAGLVAKLNSADYDIVHFIGHGNIDVASGESYVLMHNADGSVANVSAKELASALFGANVRLVFLNSCKGDGHLSGSVSTSVAQTLATEGISAVIAMNDEIHDSTAKVLAEHFYRHLADNDPVDLALAKARKFIYHQSKESLEWGVPVAYVRPDDGRIFLTKDSMGNTKKWLLAVVVLMLAVTLIAYWLVKPSPPKGLTVTDLRFTSGVIKWTDASSIEDGYIIQRLRAQDDGTLKTEQSWNVEADKSFEIDSQLQPGTRYVYRVAAARSHQGVSSKDFAEYRVTTPTVEAVSDLNVMQISDTSALASWKAPMLVPEKYKIRWSEEDSVLTSVTNVTLLGLNPGREYELRVYSIVSDSFFSEPIKTIFKTFGHQLGNQSEETDSRSAEHLISVSLEVFPPSNITCWIDSIETGLVDGRKRLALERGPHEIRLRHPEYPIFIDSFEINVEQTLSFSLKDLVGKGRLLRLEFALVKSMPEKLLQLKFNGFTSPYDAGKIVAPVKTVIEGQWEIELRYKNNVSGFVPVDSFAVYPINDPENRVLSKSYKATIDFSVAKWRGVSHFIIKAY
jgi:CHAT domain/Fibronectin type III domain